MWDNSNFGLNNSGGFVNGGESFQSPAGQKKEQVRRVQSVIPLVARQINDSPEEDFQLFETQVQIVSLIGILRNFEIQSTKATCTIEDFSGSVKAILWLEAENDSITAIPPVKEGCYVQIFGSIRNQDGEKIIMILKMVPVEDCNVITNHLLQFIHVRLATERRSGGDSKGTESMMGASTSMSVTDLGANGSYTNSMGLTRLQEQVFKILQQSKESLGVSKDTIMKHFKPNQTREVNEVLDFLLNEGHAYTTIDIDHFKATD